MRVAVTQAIDRESLTSVLYPGFGQPAGTMFPPSVPDAGEAIAADFDRGATRAALDGAGWVVSGDSRAKDGEPLELDLLVSPSPAHGPTGSQTAAEAIASELGEVGIRVTIKDVDSAVYLDEQQAGNWDLSFLETFGAPYDPAATATSFLTTGAGGVPLWVSPQLDTLVDAAVFATDESERAPRSCPSCTHPGSGRSGRPCRASTCPSPSTTWT
ncbi:MAG: ABC transporter substrate-binding protein [Egibacteraceae bacterium]